MPVRTYEQTTVSIFFTISIISFILGCISTDEYYKNKDTNKNIADRYESELTISWICFSVSSILAYCTHMMHNSKKRPISVPV